MRTRGLPVAAMRWPSLLLVLLIAAVPPTRGLAADYPPLTGRVVDQAGVISAESRSRLDQLLSAHEAKSGSQVVVVTVASLQGESIEEFGVALGRHWGIGREGEDDGVLLIVAPNEREVRIEVGYGLEGTLTDALAFQIIQNEILPRFRAGDLDGGIVAGAGAILRTLDGEYRPEPWTARSADSGAADRLPIPGWVVPVLFFGIWLLVVYIVRRHGGRGGGYGMGMPGMGGLGGRRRGGFSRGGGFSGGGGSFGGGGATGRW